MHFHHKGEAGLPTIAVVSHVGSAATSGPMDHIVVLQTVVGYEERSADFARKYVRAGGVRCGVVAQAIASMEPVLLVQTRIGEFITGISDFFF